MYVLAVGLWAAGVGWNLEFQRGSSQDIRGQRPIMQSDMTVRYYMNMLSMPNIRFC